MANVRTYPGSLHNHTQYSNARLRDCIIKEGDLLNYAVELGHEVVAITDHESVMNAVKVEKAYKKIKEKKNCRKENGTKEKEKTDFRNQPEKDSEKGEKNNRRKSIDRSAFAIERGNSGKIFRRRSFIFVGI